jgi:antirestriction protein ArdC
MEKDQAAQPPVDERIDVKSEVARTLIAAMREGNTPWQRPWDARAMSPKNATSNRPYQGVNRALLAISGASVASRCAEPADSRWVTYKQAAAEGWQVRRGERGTPIVKLVELVRDQGAGQGVQSDGPRGNATLSAEGPLKHPRFALRRYTVFNALQIDGMPARQEEREPDFDPVERAEAIMEALKSRTGLTIIHGGDKACYVPSTDQVLLPPKSSFKSIPGVQAAYGYYSVALHECSHSTSSAKRMARSEALSKRWGDEAYALEELTVEIAAACLAADTGVPITHAFPQAHIAHHASYLNSWIKAIESDSMAIFTAAKNADAISTYLLGLERQRTATPLHAEWVVDYERSESR